MTLEKNKSTITLVETKVRWLNVRSNVNAKLFMCAFQWNYYQSKTKSSDIISMNTKWKSRILRGVWKQKIYKSDWFAYIATTPKEFTAYYFDYITAQSLMVETRVKKGYCCLLTSTEIPITSKMCIVVYYRKWWQSVAL